MSPTAGNPGPSTTDAGTWTVTPTQHPENLGNSQGHVTPMGNAGTHVLEGDGLLIGKGTLLLNFGVEDFSPPGLPGELILVKD